MIYITLSKGWEVVGYVSIVFYALAILTLVSLLIAKLSGATPWPYLKQPYIFIVIFSLVKIGSGVCMVICFHVKLSEGLLIATYVLTSATLGFLIKSLMQMSLAVFDDTVLRPDQPSGRYDPKYDLEGKRESVPSFQETNDESNKSTKEKSKPKTLSDRFIQLLTIVLLVAIILNAYGASVIASDESSAMLYIKIGTFMFLAAIVLIFGLTLVALLRSSRHKLVKYMILVGCVLLVVRAAYSLVSAFNGLIFSGAPSKYMILLGHYGYYCFLGFIEECITCLIVIVSQALYAQEKYESAY